MRERAPSVAAHDAITEAHGRTAADRRRRSRPPARRRSARARGSGTGLDHGQRQSALLDRAIARAERAHHLGAADLEPAQIVRVVGEPHLIGVPVAHPHAQTKHASPRRTSGGRRLPPPVEPEPHRRMRRTQRSSAAAWRAVSCSPAPARWVLARERRLDVELDAARPSRRLANPITIGAPVAIAMRAGPVAVLAGVPKNGTNTPSRARVLIGRASRPSGSHATLRTPRGSRTPLGIDTTPASARRRAIHSSTPCIGQRPHDERDRDRAPEPGAEQLEVAEVPAQEDRAAPGRRARARGARARGPGRRPSRRSRRVRAVRVRAYSARDATRARDSGPRGSRRVPRRLLGKRAREVRRRDAPANAQPPARDRRAQRRARERLRRHGARRLPVHRRAAPRARGAFTCVPAPALPGADVGRARPLEREQGREHLREIDSRARGQHPPPRPRGAEHLERRASGPHDRLGPSSAARAPASEPRQQREARVRVATARDTSAAFSHTRAPRAAGVACRERSARSTSPGTASTGRPAPRRNRGGAQRAARSAPPRPRPSRDAESPRSGGCARGTATRNRGPPGPAR